MPSLATVSLLEAASSSALPVARLSTNTTSNSYPIHRWFNFIAGFSPALIQTAIELQMSDSCSDLKLLDPFSGCGTAPLAARLLGASAVAYEPHPFFAKISEAKANSPTYWDDMGKIREAIVGGVSSNLHMANPLSDSANAFLGKMFRTDDLHRLLSARLKLTENGLSNNPLAVLILSRILDYCCFAATDGIYKAPTSTKRTLAPHEALEKVFATINGDEREARLFPGIVEIFERSSEAMTDLRDNCIDVVVTSPPYLNNFDFAEMTRMYLYFWGLASSWGEITTRVRSRLIVNTTTALRGHKDRQEYYRAALPSRIQYAADVVVKALEKRRADKAGKKDYNYIIYPYLSQMQGVLRETARVLKPGAPFHMIVSDAALYGVHIPTPQWLAEMMSERGFQNVRCDIVRVRGHRWVLEKREGSAKGLGEYYVSGRAE